jgi:competence protein ComEC
MTWRPAVILAFAFAAGIGCENVLGPFPCLFVVIGILCLIVPASFLYPKVFPVALIVLVFLCGAFAAWNDALLPLDHISFRLEMLKGRDVPVLCRVRSWPEKKNQGLAPKRVFTCDLERVEDQPCQGRVMVGLFGDANFVYGDRVRLVGKVSSPFDFSSGERMSYPAYLARQGIYALMHVKKTATRVLIEPQRGATWAGLTGCVRLRLQDVFNHYLSAGEAGLMNAMLLGPRGDIPAHVYDIFRRTGTAHIIAISGMNMTLTALGVIFFLGIFSIPRMPRAILAAVILAFYSSMAGNSAPVARSALMAIVVILSFVIERETDALNSLALAAVVLLAADPGQLVDIGCQLSFVCVLSLIVLTPLILEPFESWGWRQDHRLRWFLIESAAVTLAAFIGSAGILAYNFGYVAPVGLIVNLPVIPLMALVTALGATVMFAGLCFPWAAGYFALGLKVVLNISVGGLALASMAPVVSCSKMPPWLAVFYYVLLVAITVCFYHFRGQMTARAFIDKPMPL